MQKRFLAVAVALAAAASVGACGSDSSSGSGGSGGSSGSSGSGGSSGAAGSSGGGNVPLSEIPSKLATALCDVVSTCLGDYYTLLLSGQDCVTLNQRQIEQGDVSVVQSAIDAGTVTYHGDKVAACIAAIEAKGCDLFSSRLPSECGAVFEGTVAEGGDCTINEECAGDNICQFSGGACPGKCSARAAAGAACAADDDCQDGLTCQSQVCTAPAKEGAACGGTAPDCLTGLYCAGADPTNGKPGACTKLSTVFNAAQGQPCDASKSQLCQVGSACEVGLSGTTVTYTCVPPVAAGAACKLAFPTECPGGQYCNIPQSTPPVLDGTCAALPGDGQDCTSTKACAAYTVCDSTTNKCVALQNDGSSCTDDNFCYSGHCVNGTCKAGLCTQ